MTETRYRLIQEYAAVGCGSLRYWRSEPVHGAALILLHGYGGRIEHWRRVMRPLARSHTVYAVDLPGFGLSCKPRRRYNREWLAQQIHEFQQQIVQRPAVFVGHSMGGMVSAQITKQYPSAAHGLVLVDSGGMRDPDRRFTGFEQALFNAIRTPGVGEVLSLFMASRDAVKQGLLQTYLDKSRVSDEMVDLFNQALTLPGGRQAYLAASREFENYQLDIQPGEVTLPVLIIWGEQDASMSVGMAPEFKRRMFPQAEITIIPNCGHNPFDERPDAFCDVLLPWLASLPQA